MRAVGVTTLFPFQGGTVAHVVCHASQDGQRILHEAAVRTDDQPGSGGEDFHPADGAEGTAKPRVAPGKIPAFRGVRLRDFGAG